MVYVLSKTGQPIMPTMDHRKVRLLLKTNKAKVVRRTPFTIQMLGISHCYTQPVVLGVDAGNKTIGLSASTEKQELFTAEVKPRNDVVEKLSTRRELRRARRYRNTRYRAPRFENRVRSKHKGWLAPSVEVKIQEHITPIKRVCKLLPITKVIVEAAEFDLQLIKAVERGLPVPVGEDYQKGEMLGFYNVRQYVLFRDHYTCQCCGAHGTAKKPVKLHVHHIESRKTGGNAPDNLITLCKDCHKLLHAGKISLSYKKRGRSTRDAVFMGIMRQTLLVRLREELNIPVWETHGYFTKYLREQHHMEKSHINDALCIAKHPTAKRADKVYLIRPVRHHNRQLHKAVYQKGGIRKSNQASTYVHGFRLFDKVAYNGQECFVWARRTSGYFLLRLLDGTKVKDGVSYKKLTLLERSKNYLIA